MVAASIAVASFGSAEDIKKPTIAVFDFDVGETVGGKITVQSAEGGARVSTTRDYETSLLSNKLVTALVGSKKVSVVERERLATITKETGLTQAAMTDPDKSVYLGKLLAAGYLLHGELELLDAKILDEKLPYNMGVQRTTEFIVGAQIRIVETETGKIVCAKGERVKMATRTNNPSGIRDSVSSEQQHEVYDELVKRLVARTIDTLFPIKVAYVSNDVVYLNRGDLGKGTRYEVLILGEVIRDPDSGEILGQVEDKLAVIEVTRGLEKMSQARVVESFSPDSTIPTGSICRLFLAQPEVGVEKAAGVTSR